MILELGLVLLVAFVTGYWVMRRIDRACRKKSYYQSFPSSLHFFVRRDGEKRYR